MTTTTDRAGRTRHAAGTPASRGGRFASGATPAAAAQLSETPADRLWSETLDRAIAFELEHRRSPVIGSDEEGHIGKWLSRQRSQLLEGTLRADRIRALDKSLPTWRSSSMAEGRAESADAYARFFDERGRHPLRTSADPHEAALALWRMGQMKRGEDADMEARAPGFSADRRATAGGWTEQLGRLQRFRQERGRLPSQRSSDRDERVLASWLTAQRAGLLGDRAERDALLDQSVPDWRGTPAPEQWQRSLQSVLDWVRANDRLPRRGSGGLADEPRLAKWIANQRQASQGRGTGAWSDSREELLDHSLPGWRGDQG